MIFLYVIGAILLLILISYFGLWEIVFDIILALCGGESSSGSSNSGLGGGKSGGGGSDGEW